MLTAQALTLPMMKFSKLVNQQQNTTETLNVTIPGDTSSRFKYSPETNRVKI